MNFPGLVVIGGSAGALPALLDLVPTLPATFSAPILLTVHTPADQPSALPQILSQAGPLPARHARQGDLLEPGVIFVAPPNHHLLVVGHHLHLSQGPKENHARPAIDVLFRSAAQAYEARVIGVLLSGRLNDGSSGLWTIEQLGGYALIQHPEEAEAPEMLLNALRQVAVKDILPAREIGLRLVELLNHRPYSGGPPPMNDDQRQRLQAEIQVSAGHGTFEKGVRVMGSPSLLTCPECHGVLGQIEEAGLTRYRCHTGHAFTAEVLLAELGEATEAALWSAARLLDEQVLLLDQLSQSIQLDGTLEAGRWVKARRLEARSNILRQFIQHPEEEGALTLASIPGRF